MAAGRVLAEAISRGDTDEQGDALCLAGRAWASELVHVGRVWCGMAAER